MFKYYLLSISIIVDHLVEGVLVAFKALQSYVPNLSIPLEV